jgi:uncharacterized protein YndB with AHSA1/START domain
MHTSVSIVIDAPRERIFDYLQDIANHRAFTDHFLVDWHLTRIDSVGRGAGARFHVQAPGNRFSWADVTFTEVERPHRIVEAGRTGKTNRVRTLGVYELAPAASGTTRVRFTFATEPATLADRIMESFGAQRWLTRKNTKALKRLRALMERNPAPLPADSSHPPASHSPAADAPASAPPGGRVTVAGG